MPSVAVISDIHANPFALEAVIEDIQQQHPDEVIVAGDLVGRGPLGSSVVDRIIGLGWPCIRGNHEDYLLSFFRKEVPDAWWRTDEWAGSRWMCAELNATHYAFLDTLEFSTISQTLPPLRVVHGSPASHSEGLGIWSSEESLDAHLESIEENVLVCAHTHRPFNTDRPGGRIVNIGSIGMPFNGDWRAQYAIFHSDPNHGWEFEFRQVEYDREAFLKAYTTSGFLSGGGITATLLKIEIETARSHLVPFLGWAKASKVEPVAANLDAFLAIYEPGESLRSFLKKLKQIQEDVR